MSPQFPFALLLLSAASLAQAAPALTPMPVAQPAAAAIDPQAKALLTQMVAADSALTAYSGTVTIQDQDAASQVSVKVQMPQYALIDASGQGKPLGEAITDGSSLDIVDYALKKYVVMPAAAGTDPVTTVLQDSHSVLLALLADPTQVPQILQSPQTQSVSMGADGTVGGTPTKTVVATVQVQPNVQETVTFGIGASDNLLRSLAFNVTLPGVDGQPAHTMSHSESFTSFALNPALTPADFVFTPPTGLQKVASLEAMQPPTWNPKLAVGTAPFPIQAKDLTGQPVSLNQYKGKVLLLDFWATWCPPCRAEIPNVVAAYQRYHIKGFDVLGISLDQPNDAAKLKAFLTANHMPWPQIYDGGYWNSKVPVEYGVQAIPFSLLIGKNGKIAAVDPRGPALAPAVQAALAAK
jgi:thiol-disulfide isomerase/thioredoxin